MRAAWIPLIVVLALAAGCLGLQNDVDPAHEDIPEEPTWHLEALESGDDHDHSDPAQHEHITTPNFETIGHHPLTSQAYGHAPGGSACASVDEGETQRIGAVKAIDNRGIILADLNDPTNPEYMGEFHLTGTLIYDVAVVPDDTHIALITSQPHEPHDPNDHLFALNPLAHATTNQPLTLTWESPCTNEPLTLLDEHADPIPRPFSILLIDVSDPENPTVADQRPISGLGHSIHATQTSERIWVLGVTDSLAQNTRHFHFYEVTDTGLNTVLEPLSVYTARASPDHADYTMGHSDGWIHEHPITGDTLAYLAAGPAFEIIDITNPHTPEPLGWWSDIGPESEGDHVLHSVTTLEETRNDRHYTVLGPEAAWSPAVGPSGIVWVLDTTDPTNPHAVAGWTLPANVEWQDRLQFSNHYMDIIDETLFVSMYHGGIWAVDISTTHLEQGTQDDPTRLDSIGVFAPTSKDAIHPNQDWRPWTPNVQDVYAIPGDILVAFDGNSGVYTFTFDDGNPMPAPEPYPFDPPPTVQPPLDDA